MKLKLFLPIILISMAVLGFNDEIPETVKTEFVYDTSLLKSNGVIRVGILYKLYPNWHIYWKNSGDSGLPTKIEFSLPEGFEAGELNWPLPKAFTREGDILDYGYENEVLLWSDIKIPANYSGKSSIPVGLKTKWISCEEICIPGKAEYNQDLTISDNNLLFETWKSRLPSKSNNKFDIKVINEDNKYNIIINNSMLYNTFKLYPIPLKTVDIENISYSMVENQQIISFTVKIYPGHKSSSENLVTVITYTDKDKNRKGFEYTVNLKDLIKNKSG